MPTAFAATAGGLLALTGMPVNVIVSEAAADVTGEGFAFFAFALVGVPLLAGTIADLPAVRRAPAAEPHRAHDPAQPQRARAHARRQYAIPREVKDHHAVPDPLLTATSGAAEVVVPPRSQLIGETFFPGMVTADADLVVLAIQRGGEDQYGPDRARRGRHRCCCTASGARSSRAVARACCSSRTRARCAARPSRWAPARGG